MGARLDGMAVALALSAALAAVPGCRSRRDDTPDDARRHVTELAARAAAFARGQRSPPLLPMSSSAEWTPRGSACALEGRVFPVDAAAWATSPWSDLGFALTRPSAYQYRLTRTGSGSRERLMVEARGDRDCDGKPSRFSTGVDATGAIAPLEVESPEE